jgi:hypothetical protein
MKNAPGDIAERVPRCLSPLGRQDPHQNGFLLGRQLGIGVIGHVIMRADAASRQVRRYPNSRQLARGRTPSPVASMNGLGATVLPRREDDLAYSEITLFTENPNKVGARRVLISYCLSGS